MTVWNRLNKLRRRAALVVYEADAALIKSPRIVRALPIRMSIFPISVKPDISSSYVVSVVFNHRYHVEYSRLIILVKPQIQHHL